MTVIVAARTIHRVGRRKSDVKQAVTFACDSQISDSWVKYFSDAPKLWVAKERFLCGGSGLISAIQAAKHYTEWPYPPSDQEVEEWLVMVMRPALYASAGMSGVLRGERKGDLDTQYEMMMAWGETLVVFDAAFGAYVPRPARFAIGSGYAEALGALGDTGPWTSPDVIEAARRATISARGCSGTIYWATTLDMEIQEAS